MVFCLFMQMNMVETQAATKVGNTKITSITQTGKKSVKVAFKKVSGAKGYTLQYRTAGGSWKTKNVTKNKLTNDKVYVLIISENLIFQIKPLKRR